MSLNPAKTKCMLMATSQTPERTAPLKCKLQDLAIGAGFETSRTWSNCRGADKVEKAY